MTYGNSLAVQWLRLHTSTAGGMGSISGWETKILHNMQHSQKKKKGHISIIFTSSMLPGQEVEYAGHTEICEFLEQKQVKDVENVETGL